MTLTKEDVTVLRQAIKEEIGLVLEEKFEAFEQKIDGKLETLEQRFDGKLETLQQRFDGKLENLEQRLEGKLENLEQRLDEKFDQKLAPIRDITKKLVGIQIEIVDKMDTIENRLGIVMHHLSLSPTSRDLRQNLKALD